MLCAKKIRRRNCVSTRFDPAILLGIGKPFVWSPHICVTSCIAIELFITKIWCETHESFCKKNSHKSFNYRCIFYINYAFIINCSYITLQKSNKRNLWSSLYNSLSYWIYVKILKKAEITSCNFKIKNNNFN